MSDMMVKDLAGKIGIPAQKLVEQLGEAGIKVSKEDDYITEEQKQTLLSFLQKRHGKGQEGTIASPKKITLKRRSTSEIQLGSSSRLGGRSVSVEVRKKRTLVKKPVTTETIQQQETVEIPVDSARKAQEDLLIEREAEARRRREEAIRKERESKVISEEKVETKTETETETETEKPVEEVPVEEKKPEKKLSPAQLTQQKIEEAEAKRRAANLGRLESEKAKIARKEAREEEKKLEKERAVAKVAAEAKAKEDEALRVARKERMAKSEQPASADKAGRRGGKNKSRGAGREELHVNSGKGGRRKKKGRVARQPVIETSSEHGFSLPTEPVIHTVEVPETIKVSDLAQRMSVKAAEVIKSLMGLGTMATINQVLDQDTATIVIEEMGHVAKPVQDNEIELALQVNMEALGEPVSRAPVVTVMGHVDHGKTSLLDYIRRTKVASGEAGGITQHIGAYKVETSQGEITFLDTPGHAAFTEMRSRGAKVTDIVILVVAADDSVMPQTIEAVQHAKAANAVLIIAMNKMDKEGANPDKVKQELANHDVIPEDWGGDVPFIPVSALTGQGIDDLLDSISLQAEVMELKAPNSGPSNGIVIESRLDKGRGTIVTVLVQNGTLSKGDIVVVGQEYGRIRAMFNEQGEMLDKAGPSTPVEVLGLSGTPSSGDDLQVAPDERKAREIADFRMTKARELKMAQQQSAKLDEMFNKMEEGDVKTLNVVVKADVHGSSEAVSQSLTKLSTDLVKVKVVATGVGGINETDAQLAAASNAILVGFNVRADNAARKVIAEKGLDVQYFSIIYDLIDVITQAMTGMLDDVYKDEIIGLARVDDVFSSPKFGDIAGCLVTEGVVKRANPIRVLRDNVVIYEGELESLRRFKDDVNEVQSGIECGIGVKNYTDVKPGDQIEVFERVLVKPTL